VVRAASVTATQIDRVARAIDRFLMFVLSLVILATLSIALYGVIARFILHNAAGWTAEADSYLFIWLTFLGAGIVYRERGHPAIVVLVDVLPRILQRICRAVTDLVVFGVGTIFVVYGIQTIQIVGDSTASSFEMPMRFPYLAVPIGGAILALFAIADLVADVANVGEAFKVIDPSASLD
jgi:TRAP-type transport system small permease protein